MIKIIPLTMAILCCGATCCGAGVTGTHPRVWIDNTIKSRLQADAAANTQEWQDLKNYCDSKLAVNNGGVYRSSGYHYNDWYNLLMSYGLCFQATGNQTYGNEGVVYLTGLLRDKADGGTIGDGLGGDLGIRTDSGYVARSAGTGVAIGRDWLDGATSLTPSLISEAVARITTWWAWVSVNGYSITDPRDNYYYGHFTMLYTSAFSFFGDDGYQSSWLTLAEYKWANEVLPIINGGFYDGGDWAEGWNYAPWAYQEMVGYMLARDTATDDANPWGSTNIYDDLAKSQVHFLYPNKGHFSDGGVWTGSIKADPRSTLSRFLASMTPIDSTRKGTLKWFVDNLTYEPNASEMWQKFLYKVSDITPVTPSVSNMGGLSYTTNIGHLVARSDNWANADASMLEFFAYNDRKPIANGFTDGSYAVGDIRFFSRGVSLVADGARDQFTGHYKNQLFVTGSHNYAPYQEPWLFGKSGISGYPELSLKTSSGPGYAYGKVKNAQNAYDGTYYANSPSLDHYDRSLLAIWPDTVIVYDNATAKSSSNDVSVRWWFPREPTVSGQTLTTTDAKADLKVSVIGVTGGFSPPGTCQSLVAATGTATYRPGYYFSDFQTTGTPLNNQMITVMQATDHGATPGEVASLPVTGGIGVTADGVDAVFSANSSGGDLDSVAFSSAAPTHIIADLPVNSGVTITRNGIEISGSPFDSGNAGVIKFSTPEGISMYTVSIVAYIPPTATCSTDISLCDASNCSTVGGGYWYLSSCHSDPQPAPPDHSGAIINNSGNATINRGGAATLIRVQ